MRKFVYVMLFVVRLPVNLLAVPLSLVFLTVAVAQEYKAVLEELLEWSSEEEENP